MLKPKKAHAKKAIPRLAKISEGEISHISDSKSQHYAIHAKKNDLDQDVDELRGSKINRLTGTVYLESTRGRRRRRPKFIIQLLQKAILRMRGPRIDQAVKYATALDPTTGIFRHDTLTDVLFGVRDFVANGGSEDEIATIDRILDLLSQTTTEIPGILLDQLREDVGVRDKKDYNSSSNTITEKLTDTSEQFEITISDELKVRLAALDIFSRKNAGVGIVEYILANFPEITTSSIQKSIQTLPQEAPEIYGGLRGPETPPEFVQRVYGQWLGRGLTRAHIKHLDLTLYVAINNWQKKPGCEWPADVDLPTKSQQTSRQIDALRSSAPDGQIGHVIGDFTAREADRIRSAIQRRSK